MHHNTGRVRSPETRALISANNARFWLGKKRSPHTSETKLKISESKKGKPSWNKGLLGFRAGEKRTCMPEGEKHWSYKGAKVGYRALHYWVVKNLGKAAHCEHCGATEIPVGYKRYFQWANRSRQYRHVLTDWLSLCVKCHRQYDTQGIGEYAH